ncbi:uncharacterized protein [Macrobrachium rosenbergii]|uniref:uncharacterized protein n=1 Tax=Macrobrachium rosenbergii TaxID=79674 RepID=UPI0034D5AD2C
METVRMVLSAVRENDFMLTVDLMDAYFQVPVHTSSHWYLRFTLDRVVYQFKVPSFGLSTAPQVFTRVFTLISVWAHLRGIRLLRYLDNWLVLTNSRLQSLQDRDRLLELCHELGVVINFRKSDLIPKQKVQYLGMLIDTAASRVFPSQAQINMFRKVVRQFLSQQDQPAQQWQVVIGHLSSLEKLVPHGRLHIRSLQWRLRDFWDQSLEPQLVLIPIPQEVRDDLAWWLDVRNLCIGTPLSPRPTRLASFLRCIEGVLWSSPGGVADGEHVGPSRTAPSHQRPGDESSVLGSPVLPGSFGGTLSSIDERQHDRSGIHQQAGGSCLSSPSRVDVAGASMGSRPLSGPVSQVHSGQEERPGRHAQP